MNDKEIQEFWDILCSFKGENLNKEIETLVSRIQYPRYLCRYRSINNNNLEALRTNRMYFSKASNYDDPFDTFLNIDINKIKEEFESNFKSSDSIVTLAEAMSDMLKNVPNNLPTEYTELITNPDGLQKIYQRGITNQFLSYIYTMRTKIQEEILSACFSENFLNESLWLKYADRHKGYALIYDLTNEENLHCGKRKECTECGMHNYGYALYPIFYSNIPYDATNLAKFIVIKDFEEQLGINIPDVMKEEFKLMSWDIIRCSLIKKECHKYDAEWRMISNCSMEPNPTFIEMVPDKVVIGLRTSPTDANLIIAMAEQAGIKHIYKSYIDMNNQLNAKEIIKQS